MAYYEREILVPYLHDVSSIELLFSKLLKQYFNLKNKRDNLVAKANNIKNQQAPSRPSTSDTFAACIAFIIFTFIAAVITIVIVRFINIFSTGIAIIAGIIGFLITIFMFYGLIDSIKDNNVKKNKYSNSLAIYNNRFSEANKLLNEANKIDSTMKKIYAETKRIEKIRNDVYNINIIPSRYRNLNVACYLYDYFSTSRETDLDKILQTMLLDEINQKMDRVINKLESVIINQRCQLAMQYESNTLLKKQHKEHMTALANLERNQELHSEYLRMIDVNTTVSAVFSAANYMQINEYLNNK
ncbi:MAG: hypothetical protein IJN69_06305 [Oscillospiraceae bacterium]|nr:hypothetical protein [Oscillospiraceae bacterium]